MGSLIITLVLMKAILIMGAEEMIPGDNTDNPDDTGGELGVYQEKLKDH